ncbi:hypothetical protein TruAng_008055 [Truncatella angustata]|nr:hypothetical protein TruAng_008055 [Truncatella angustata]
MQFLQSLSQGTEVNQATAHSMAPPLDIYSDTSVRNESELSLIMAFLDYVFPKLFPCYQPSAIEGGRSWLLVLASQSDAFYHTIASTTLYFFSMVPVTSNPIPPVCSSRAWSGLYRQSKSAIAMLQGSLQNMVGKSAHSALVRSIHLLGSVLRFLEFEAMITASESWIIHINAAVELFEHILSQHRYGSIATPFMAILDELVSPKAGPASSAIPFPTWNATQAAYRFFVSNLMVNDIISGCALRKAPKLKRYHNELLGRLSRDQKPTLDLEDITGCQNWVLIQIGEIAALTEWKDRKRKEGSLSSPALSQRASTIQSALHAGCQQLESCSVTRIESEAAKESALDPPYFATDYLLSSELRGTITHIWAHAAFLYLQSVVVGCQPSNPQIHDCIEQTIYEFKILKSPTMLRSLSWPIFVTGSLASGEQTSSIRALIDSMGTLYKVGTTHHVIAALEKLWADRSASNSDDWDLAIYLDTLEWRPLLI